jgi:hypothetical protein
LIETTADGRGIEDIPFVMAAERPCFFFARIRSQPIGFAIIRDQSSPERLVA